MIAFETVILFLGKSDREPLYHHPSLPLELEHFKSDAAGNTSLVFADIAALTFQILAQNLFLA